MALEDAEVEFRKGLKELPPQIVGGVATIYTELDYATQTEVDAAAAVDKPITPAQAKAIALANASTKLAAGSTVTDITISGATKEQGFNFASTISTGSVTLSIANGTFQFATVGANLTINLPTLPTGTQPTSLTILLGLSAAVKVTVAGKGTSFVWLGETPILPTDSGSQIWLFCMWNPLKGRWSISATSEASPFVPLPESMTLTPGDGKVTVQIDAHVSAPAVTQYQKDTGAWTTAPASPFSVPATNGTPTTIRSRHGNGLGEFSESLAATVTPSARSLALVTGDPAALPSYFPEFHALIEGFGWTLTKIKANLSTDLAKDYNYTPFPVVMFDAAMNSSANNVPVNLNKPMLVCEVGITDDLGLSTSTAFAADTNSLMVVEPTHPVWAGISGVTAGALIKIFSTGATNTAQPLVSALAPGAILIAKHPTADPARAMLYELPAGAIQHSAGTATGGLGTAPNRRVIGPFDTAPARYINATGQALLKNMLEICFALPSVTVP